MVTFRPVSLDEGVGSRFMQSRKRDSSASSVWRSCEEMLKCSVNRIVLITREAPSLGGQQPRIERQGSSRSSCGNLSACRSDHRNHYQPFHQSQSPLSYLLCGRGRRTPAVVQTARRAPIASTASHAHIGAESRLQHGVASRGRKPWGTSQEGKNRR